MIKTVIILMLIAIVGSLFSGLLYMFKDQGNSDRMVKALTLRIGLSITLFLLLLAGFYFGLIPPQKV